MTFKTLSWVAETSISIELRKMKLLVLLLPIISVESQLQSESTSFGLIRTCDVKYVKPGDDFRIRCQSDHSILTKVNSCDCTLIIL